jgi:hypothetical protein
LATHTPLARIPLLGDLGLDGASPLLIIDVDEVLGLFMEALGTFLATRGLEFRVEQFSLFKNIYRPGEMEHLAIDEGKRHFDDFFRNGSSDMSPAPGAAEALRALSREAGIIILSNAPAPARLSRARWLGRHGLDYPLILNVGPKGPLVANLTAQAQGPVVFVDDLISNLNSVERDAPTVHRFQMVADPRLRPLAPSAPERHRRIDLWPDLQDAIAALIAA